MRKKDFILTENEVFNLLEREIFKVDTGITGDQIKDFLNDNRVYVYLTAKKHKIDDLEHIVDIINIEY